MIFGRRTNWISKEVLHHDIRKAFSDRENAHLYFKNWRFLSSLNGKKNEPRIEDYIISLSIYLRKLIILYETSFDPQYYRRQSEEVYLFVDEDDFSINATATGSSIYISIGLVLAIEDISIGLMADPQTLFAQNLLEKYISNRFIRHLPFSEIFDDCRYIDYSPIIDSIQNGKQEFPSFLPYLFKFISVSEFRDNLGELVSSISLYWIISHEDAHNYLGHILYAQSELGISPNNNSFSEILGLFSNDKEERIRKSFEIEADRNACARIVDHIVDSEFFDIHPLLYNCRDELESLKDKYDFTEEEILCTILIRLCIISAVSAIGIFERNVIKRNANRHFYPDFFDRVHNVIDITFSRAKASLENNPNYGLRFPFDRKKFPILIFFIIADVKDIFRTIYFDDRVMKDLSVAENEKMKEIKSMLDDSDFFNELYLTTIFVKLPNKSLLNLNLKYKDYFITYYRNRCEDHEIWINELSKYRYQANPQRPHKVTDSINEYKGFLDDLRQKCY